TKIIAALNSFASVAVVVAAVVAVVGAVVEVVGAVEVLLQAPANIPTSMAAHKCLKETIEEILLVSIPIN
ncbi:MAG: hypothetical protein ACK5XR_18720, partial [Pseudanabaena sp.]